MKMNKIPLFCPMCGQKYMIDITKNLHIINCNCMNNLTINLLEPRDILIKIGEF